VNGPIGVGVIGAGPVTQAIHLPTLASLGDAFAIRHVMDVDQSVATEAGVACAPGFVKGVVIP
jgi:myo-inositol 2-dehydrogenase/D-chiro-inositol 1-dehydrogenase